MFSQKLKWNYDGCRLHVFCFFVPLGSLFMFVAFLEMGLKSNGSAMSFLVRPQAEATHIASSMVFPSWPSNTTLLSKPQAIMLQLRTILHIKFPEPKDCKN